jgi:glycolate oxidase iron-sulfur subunit
MRVAYFSGCGVHYLYPQAAQAVYDLLRDHDVEVLTPDHDCCGLPANSAGDLESAKACAKKNIELFASLDVEAIIVNDDSCAGFMMRYGEVLKGDPEAAIFSKKVMNLSQFLTKLHWSEESFERDISGARVHIRFAPLQSEPALGERSREKEFRAKVTYHHPCQMGNGHKETEAPLHILRSIAGKNFVELDEANWCCGGAGIYCLKNPKLAEAVLDRKIANIKKSGAGIVVTEASSCLLHINAGLKKKGLGEKVRCVHLGEFLSGRD